MSKDEKRLDDLYNKLDGKGVFKEMKEIHEKLHKESK